MQRLNGDQDGILHAFDLDTGGGGHAGEHSLCLFQLNDRRIGAGRRGSTVDLGQGACEVFFTDRCHGNTDGLTQRQGEDVGLIHTDGDEHLFVSRNGGNGCAAFLIIDAVHTAIRLRKDCSVSLNGQQLQKDLLLLTAAAKQGVIVGAVCGILQRKELGCIGHLAVEADLHRVHGAGISGDPQGAVDIQGPGADLVTVRIQHSDGLFIFRTIVTDEHHCLTIDNGIYGTGDLVTVGKHHTDTVTGSELVSLDLHSHAAIQRQESQCTMVIHDIRHFLAGFCENRLHTTADAGINGFAGFIVLRIAELFIQRFDLRLKIRHGVDDGGHIHHRQNIALGDGVICADQHFRDLHTLGHCNGFQVHIRQASGAGYNGADGSSGDLIGKHFA